MKEKKNEFIKAFSKQIVDAVEGVVIKESDSIREYLSPNELMFIVSYYAIYASRILTKGEEYGILKSAVEMLDGFAETIKDEEDLYRKKAEGLLKMAEEPQQVAEEPKKKTRSKGKKQANKKTKK